MATNPYFKSNFDSVGAKNLVQSLIIEAIKMYGMDMYYVPRERVAFDQLYGEDKLSAFSRAYKLEFYLESVMGFGGDRELISKFGFEVRDELSLLVARKRFNTEVAANEPTIQIPREGDLVFFPLDNGIFEITFADEDVIFHQIGNLFTYSLRLKRFEMAGEKFDTGVDKIDAVNEHAISTLLQLDTGTGNFVAGEVITQGDSQGEVIAWDDSTSQIVFIKRKGEFVEGSITGGTSGAVWNYVPSIVDDGNSNEPNHDNKFIENQATEVVDFDENNPYSEG